MSGGGNGGASGGLSGGASGGGHGAGGGRRAHGEGGCAPMAAPAASEPAPLPGLQTALLPAADWRAGLELFLDLARESSLRACELHLATDHYAAALPGGEADAAAVRVRIRPAVAALGLHLPFTPLPAGGGEPAALAEGLAFAARIGADYAVLHLRDGGGGGGGSDSGDGGSAALSGGVEAWAARVAPLARRACALGVRLLLENADDERDPGAVARVAAAAGAGVCLDVGHLYERRYPARGLVRKLLVANDRWSPRPFAWTFGLPAAGGPAAWERAAARLGETVACVHVHDHDGRTAHRPLGSGRLDWSPLRRLRERWAGRPVILEADLREAGEESARAAARRLREMMGL